MPDVRGADGRFYGIPHKRLFSFAFNTTYGCGGTAKIALYPRNEEEGAAVFSAAMSSGEKFCVLGCGSNVLAQDGFFNGYVISTAKMKSISMLCTDGKNVILSISSGTKVSELLTFCNKNGLTGIEYLAGIPASIGGLTYMNGGADGKFIGNNIECVRVASPHIFVFTAEDCNFTYKHSTMRDINCLILGVNIRLERADPQTVGAKIAERLAHRRRALPSGRSCGCVFENYCGVSAGKIIENAGLVGAHIGGAYVSPAHANFILNRGRRSADVYALIKYVKECVYKKYGITLKEEVCYIGEFK